jgi:hypothetical protein
MKFYVRIITKVGGELSFRTHSSHKPRRVRHPSVCAQPLVEAMCGIMLRGQEDQVMKFYLRIITKVGGELSFRTHSSHKPQRVRHPSVCAQPLVEDVCGIILRGDEFREIKFYGQKTTMLPLV